MVEGVVVGWLVCVVRVRWGMLVWVGMCGGGGGWVVWVVVV